VETDTISQPISGRMIVVCCECHEVLSNVPVNSSRGILSRGYCPECADRALEEFDFYMRNEHREAASVRHHP
jgi:hypothetical protein